MPRLDVPIGPNGPIVEVRLWIGSEDEASRVAEGRAVPRPFSVLGLVDTGAQMTAIQRPLAARMDLPCRGELQLSSSVLGGEVRAVPLYVIRMTFGAIEAPDPPKWRNIRAAGVSVVSPGVTVLIGRDLLGSCRFTYDGRKSRFMMSY